MRVLVAGAGISGLAAARGLHAAGHEVTVLEQAPALRLGGGAIQLWPNGTTVLADLSVDLEGLGQRLASIRVRTAAGRQVMTFDLERVQARLGAPAMAMARGSLITRLTQGLPAGTVRFGARLTSLRTDEHGVRVEAGNGEEYAADLLVGADGMRSKVRAVLFGDGPAQHTGIATWQGMTPAPFDPGADSMMHVGRTGDCGYFGAGDGLMHWFFDVPWSADDPVEDKPLEMLRARYGTWASPVPELLDTLTDGDLEVFPHTRHKIPRQWARGRCVLLGDAAHAMPPVLAQGTNQALEDVAVLLRRLTVDPDIETALDRYGHIRRRKAARASTVATRALTVTGPRTLMQAEPVMRASMVPNRLATWGFGTLLQSLSNRL